jgi:hypothetical protein
MKKAAKKITIEDLAVMVANGFEKQDAGLEEFKKDIKEDFVRVRADILNLNDKFVSNHRFEELVSRFNMLEVKMKGKK